MPTFSRCPSPPPGIPSGFLQRRHEFDAQRHRRLECAGRNLEYRSSQKRAARYDHASQIAFGAPRGGKDSLAGILRPRPRGQRLPLRRQRLFAFSEYPFRLLCKCIQSVHHGQVWANSEQLQYLIEVVTQVPSLRRVKALGGKLLTPREEQVVALVADGPSNREVAHELCLSEHTIKKYLFRIFDKLGISSRVELVLYAVSHGGARQAEWVAGQ